MNNLYAPNKYPKNYHASGLGVLNLAALGYSDAERNQNQKSALYPALPIITPSKYPHAALTGPQPPQQNLPYPVSTGYPHPGSVATPFSYPGSNAPYPTVGFVPYPTAPSLPYPTSFNMMPMPGDNISQGSGSSGYGSMFPSMPSLPDGVDSHFNTQPIPTLYPSLNPTDDSDISAPSPDDDPSVGIPEIPFNNIKIPMVENMFWIPGIKNDSAIK